MKKYINRVICGDCLEIMKDIPDNSISTIITDPPYNLSTVERFKAKDSGEKWNVKSGVFHRSSKGFMGKEWDGTGISFSIELWQEVLRVAKPGATLLCFGGTRTYHRLACAIEDAGWIIKDCIVWIYASGFPKATDISKQIDKGAGKKREVIGERKSRFTPAGRNETECMGKHKVKVGEDGYERHPITEPVTPDAQLWDGWKSHGLKPAYEPILVAMKPNEGSYAENALKWGCAGLNIEQARIPTTDEEHQKLQDNRMSNRTIRAGEVAKGYGMKPQGLIGSKQSRLGRFPANLILECICDEVEEGKQGKVKYGSIRTKPIPTSCYGWSKSGKPAKPNAPDNYGDKAIIHTNPACPCYMLDKQSGKSKSTPSKGHIRSGNVIGDNRTPIAAGQFGDGAWINGGIHNDTGGASRFFYCAKASRAERNAGCEKLPIKDPLTDILEHDKQGTERMRQKPQQNIHPTVKPLKLMEYLCLLTKTPTGGIVLDPFAGSGTTGMACKKIGRDYILIEKEKEYCEIAEARLKAMIYNEELNLEGGE